MDNNRQAREGIMISDLRATFLNHFSYDPETGNLIWKLNHNKYLIGTVAGSVHKRLKRRYVMVNRKNHIVSRVIWTMFNGEIPEGIEIIPKDGDHLNTKVENLEASTISNTRLNLKSRSKRHRELPKGVHRVKNSFKAYITWHKELIALGTFLNPEDAHKAYLKALDFTKKVEAKNREGIINHALV